MVAMARARIDRREKILRRWGWIESVWFRRRLEQRASPDQNGFLWVLLPLFSRLAAGCARLVEWLGVWRLWAASTLCFSLATWRIRASVGESRGLLFGGYAMG